MPNKPTLTQIREASFRPEEAASGVRSGESCQELLLRKALNCFSYPSAEKASTLSITLHQFLESAGDYTFKAIRGKRGPDSSPGSNGILLMIRSDKDGTLGGLFGALARAGLNKRLLQAIKSEQYIIVIPNNFHTY